MESTGGNELTRPGASCDSGPIVAPQVWKGYHVRLDSFEGPLDLLLFLISKNELDIYNIPIAVITGQYLASLDGVEDLDLDLAGEYLLMAATLLAIKARTLLPGKEEIWDEEEEVSPEQALSLRLLEYQTYREVSRRLSEAASRRMRIHERGSWLGFDEDEMPEEEGIAPDVSMNEMLKAFTKLIFTIKPTEGHRVRLSPFTVEEKSTLIRRRIEQEGAFEFLSLFTEMVDREELIVTFVALLELIHLGVARVIQRGNFQKLIIKRVSGRKK